MFFNSQFQGKNERYIEGYFTYVANGTPKCCPHSEGSAEHKDWIEGYTQAREDDC